MQNLIKYLLVSHQSSIAQLRGLKLIEKKINMKLVGENPKTEVLDMKHRAWNVVTTKQYL